MKAGTEEQGGGPAATEADSPRAIPSKNMSIALFTPQDDIGGRRETAASPAPRRPGSPRSELGGDGMHAGRGMSPGRPRKT